MDSDTTDAKSLPKGTVQKPLYEGIIRLSLEEVTSPSLSYTVNPIDRKERRGLCRIFNQRNFEPHTQQPTRDGSDEDAKSCEKIFRKLGYDTQTFLNSNYSQLMSVLQMASKTDHSAYDSFICVILSHGVRGEIFAADRSVSVDALVEYFRGDRCPTLVGKPKCFFIQACRGTALDAGAAIPMVTDAVGDVVVTKLPVEADILLAYSTVPGYFAWRNARDGSWFIQELCRTLEDDTRRSTPNNLLTLLTVVSRCVAYKYRSKSISIDFNAMCQMTTFCSTLTRLFYLTGTPPK